MKAITYLFATLLTFGCASSSTHIEILHERDRNAIIIKNINTNRDTDGPNPPVILDAPSPTSKLMVEIYINNGVMEIVPPLNTIFSLEADGVVIHPKKNQPEPEAVDRRAKKYRQTRAKHIR